MKLRLGSSIEEIPRIEIVPLIDVIFCILTFFILAALQLTRQQAISIDLPSAKTATVQTQDMLVVSVDAAGQTYVDQQPLSQEQLTLLLQGYKQTRPQGVLVLYADQAAVYSDVVRVLDLLRSIGGRRVALATVPEESGRRPKLPDSMGSPNPTLPFNPANPLNPPNPPSSPFAMPSAPIPFDPNLTAPSPSTSPGAGQFPDLKYTPVVPSESPPP